MGGALPLTKEQEASLSRGAKALRKILNRHESRNKALLEAVHRYLVHTARKREREGHDPVVNADDAMDGLDRVLAVERELKPDAPDPDRRFLGAVWRQGAWEKTGTYVKSRIEERHNRPIPVWRLAQ